MTKLYKSERWLNYSHNDGGYAYLLQNVAIHFNHTVSAIYGGQIIEKIKKHHFGTSHANLSIKYP